MEREIIEMTMIIESLILSVIFSIFLGMLNMNNNEIERKNLHIRHPSRHEKNIIHHHHRRHYHHLNKNRMMETLVGG